MTSIKRTLLGGIHPHVGRVKFRKNILEMYTIIEFITYNLKCNHYTYLIKYIFMNTTNIINVKACEDGWMFITLSRKIYLTDFDET